MHPWRHTSPELLEAVSASCISCRASKGRCLVMLLCRSSPVLCWQSLITVIRCWSAFPQSSWTDSRPSSTQQLVCLMLWRQITLQLCWKTYTGYESRKGSSTSYVSLRSSVNIVWHHLPFRPTSSSTSRSNGAQTASEIIEFASARCTSY